MQRTIGEMTIECIKGDITRQGDIDVIVNAANRQLKGGGGVDGAIHRAAGPQLLEASRALAPIEAGQGVITPAFDLPNDWVVHCAGPVYSDDPEVPGQLAGCYRSAVELAEDKAAASIAFPAISAGIYGYPLAEAATIAMETLGEAARSVITLKQARFVLFSDEAHDAFSEALSILT
ncbi:macro domain-containing protein [uncultured Salinisphaera sp.]|uniref:macro domain-containing protein n=1 Tax=uncultured Salinisphaera sp. TaxID=359372 RepID=UPI0032B1429B|tara:strand:- start:4609 stop:5139 length:531 start_codon:yes stop_codon:yes gene_type:complete